MSCNKCENRPTCTEPCEDLNLLLQETDIPQGDVLDLLNPESTEVLTKHELQLKQWHDDAIEKENQYPSTSVTNAEGLPPCKAKKHSKYKVN